MTISSACVSILMFHAIPIAPFRIKLNLEAFIVTQAYDVGCLRYRMLIGAV